MTGKLWYETNTTTESYAVFGRATCKRHTRKNQIQQRNGIQGYPITTTLLKLLRLLLFVNLWTPYDCLPFKSIPKILSKYVLWTLRRFKFFPIEGIFPYLVPDCSSNNNHWSHNASLLIPLLTKSGTSILLSLKFLVTTWFLTTFFHTLFILTSFLMLFEQDCDTMCKNLYHSCQCFILHHISMLVWLSLSLFFVTCVKRNLS
jgi:hypothetical protein